MEYKVCTFPQCGYIEARLKKEDLLILLDEIEELKVHINNVSEFGEYGRDHLAGNIKSEYELKKSFDSIEELLMPYVSRYLDSFSVAEVYDVNKTPHNLALFSAWVNFQNKYEFNPVHHHAGVLSFVIWIDIPYLVTEEYRDGCREKFCSGAFEFIYATALRSTNMHRIEADSSYNFNMILFPSALAHTVYPFFSSDKYRISVSGNFGYDT